jgi:hypothetical protein
MVISLTGCAIDTSSGIPPHESLIATEPGPMTDVFKASGSPLLLDSAEVDFAMSAENVRFGYARGKSGKLVATLEDATDGHLAVALSQQSLETAVLGGAKRGAAASGVAVQKVEISLKSLGPRDLEILLKITAKKFVTTVIRISGRLSIDDELNATASNLKAEGEGMVGSIVVGFLRPHLEKLNGQTIPLMAFSLGNVRLHDITVNTDAGLRITAEFGNAG